MHEFAALCMFATGDYSRPAAVLTIPVGRRSRHGLDDDERAVRQRRCRTPTQLRALEAYCKQKPDDAASRFVLAYHYLVAGMPTRRPISSSASLPCSPATRWPSACWRPWRRRPKPLHRRPLRPSNRPLLRRPRPGRRPIWWAIGGPSAMATFSTCPSTRTASSRGRPYAEGQAAGHLGRNDGHRRQRHLCWRARTRARWPRRSSRAGRTSSSSSPPAARRTTKDWRSGGCRDWIARRREPRARARGWIGHLAHPAGCSRRALAREPPAEQCVTESRAADTPCPLTSSRQWAIRSSFTATVFVVCVTIAHHHQSPQKGGMICVSVSRYHIEIPVCSQRGDSSPDQRDFPHRRIMAAGPGPRPSKLRNA